MCASRRRRILRRTRDSAVRPTVALLRFSFRTDRIGWQVTVPGQRLILCHHSTLTRGYQITLMSDVLGNMPSRIHKCPNCLQKGIDHSISANLQCRPASVQTRGVVPVWEEDPTFLAASEWLSVDSFDYTMLILAKRLFLAAVFGEVSKQLTMS